MWNDIAPATALQSLDTPNKDLVTFISTQKSEYNTILSDLVTNGWHGLAAGEYSAIVSDFLHSQDLMGSALDAWNTTLQTEADALKNVITAATTPVLSCFGGNGGNGRTTHLGFDDAEGAPLKEMCSGIITALYDFVAVPLAPLASKTYSLSRNYDVDLADLTAAETELAQQFSDLSACVCGAAATYADALTGFGNNLADAGSALQAAKKEFASASPACTAADVSSPIYRAQEMARILQSLPAADRAAIEDMCYSAQEPYLSAFFANIDKVNIVISTNGTNMYNPLTGNISLDITRTAMVDLDGTQQVPEWYMLLFHEIGHMIDFKSSGPLIIWPSTTGAHSGGALEKALEADVRMSLDAMAQELMASGNYTLTNDEIQQAIDNIMAGKSAKKLSASKPNSQNELDFQLALEKEMRKVLRGERFFDPTQPVPASGTPAPPAPPDGATFSASDLYGGVTNNVVVGDRWHNHLVGDFGNYWWEPIGFLECEAFANHFSQGFTGNVNEGAVDAALLPTSWQILDDMVDEIGDASRQKLGWSV